MELPCLVEHSDRKPELLALDVIEGADREPFDSPVVLDLEIHRREYAAFHVVPAGRSGGHDSPNSRRPNSHEASRIAAERAARADTDASDADSGDVSAAPHADAG